jgi:hypothetical protein
MLALFERTAETELDPKAVQSIEAAQAMAEALKKPDDKARIEAFQNVAEKYADRPAGVLTLLNIMALRIRDGAPEEDIRKSADAAVSAVAPYGPELLLTSLRQIARQLMSNEKLAGLAVEYAKQAEKALAPDDPAEITLPILKTLLAALRKAGKGEEAKPIEARIAKLDEVLDQEFAKNAVPFQTPAFAGRKGKSNRIAVVELFTGAQCAPCVAADVAFDGLLKAYKPQDVILLQYHLHIPGPDPLTNAESERRSKYYGLQATPTFYLDGVQGPAVGGPKAHAKQAFEAVRAKLDEALEKDAGANLKLSATRKGDNIDVQAEVSGLMKPGEDVRLRFVLVEDVVRYLGSNGQRLHHHVVRAFPGGTDGFALPKETAKQSVRLDVTELTKTLNEYLVDANKKRAFPDEERPMNLKNLKVVAFIQDDNSKDILQAAQVDLHDAN